MNFQGSFLFCVGYAYLSLLSAKAPLLAHW